NLARLEEVDRFAEDLAQVGAVDLVDVEQEGSAPRLLHCRQQGAAPDVETQCPFGRIGREADDEVLVSERGVKLHRHAATAEELPTQLVGEPALAGARWSLKHDESPLAEERVDLGRRSRGKQIRAKRSVEGAVLALPVLKDLVAALVGIEVEERLKHH